MTTEHENPFDLIATRLDGGRKWIKGRMHDEHGGVCLYGAFSEATHGQGFSAAGMWSAIHDVTAEQFPDRMKNVPSEFNDHKDTVFSDIEDIVLPKARQLYEDRRAGL